MSTENLIPPTSTNINPTQTNGAVSATELPMSALTAKRLIWFGFIMTICNSVLNAAVGSSLFARWPMVIQVFGFAGVVCGLLAHYFNRRAPSSNK